MKNKKKYLNKIDVITLILHVIAVAVLIILSTLALRQNNLKMLELRDKVFSADQSGVGVGESLTKLRNFVSSHMNTELPGSTGIGKAIQLKYSYERAVKQEQDRFNDEVQRLRQLAKSNCLNSINEFARVDCEQNYLKSNPIKPSKEILPEMYSIEFISPRWSFDIAGWLIISTVALLLFLIARLISLLLAKKYIKDNYN